MAYFDPILQVFGDDPEALKEFERIKALRGEVDAAKRLQRLGAVGALATDEGLRGFGDNLYRTGVGQEASRTQAMQEGYEGLKQTRARAKERADEQAWRDKQFEADEKYRQRQLGLSEQELGFKRLKEAREAQGGDWKVRVDMTGNPVGWYNDRGDFVTLDGQRFSVNADNLGGGAPRGAPTASPGAISAGGPAQPTAGPAGDGGGGRMQPQAGPFGFPSPQAFAGPQPGLDSGQPMRDAQPTGIDESRAASLRMGRLKTLPAEQQNKYGAAISQRDRLPSLIQEIEANPRAFGLTSDVAQFIPGQPGTPGAVAQNVVRGIQDKFRDPKHAEVRSRVYQEAYEVIHALAGAALSTGEANRILGFMPGPTDPPEKILANLRSAYDEANRTINTLEAMAGVPEQIRSPRELLPPRGSLPQDESIIEVNY